MENFKTSFSFSMLKHSLLHNQLSIGFPVAIKEKLRWCGFLVWILNSFVPGMICDGISSILQVQFEQQ